MEDSMQQVTTAAAAAAAAATATATAGGECDCGGGGGVRQHCKTKHVTKSAKTKINEKDGEEFLVLRRTKATDGDEYLVVKRTRVKVGTEHRPTKRVRDIDVEQWVHGTNVVSSTKNEVLWYLEDATGRLHVVEAHKATGFTLNRESSVFEENKQLCSRCQVCGQEGSVKVVGLERTERVLPTGTTFTVVGEAYKDRGTVLIKRPRELGRFYVSRRGIDQIISDLKEASTGKDATAAIFAFCGGVLLAFHALL
uniref:RING-type E3 ubiquitin transferase n=1 Tax=Oryza rufipogon TaxID=4529 RepID=A0A0E0NVC0_ORYRU